MCGRTSERRCAACAYEPKPGRRGLAHARASSAATWSASTRVRGTDTSTMTRFIVFFGRTVKRFPTGTSGKYDRGMTKYALLTLDLNNLAENDKKRVRLTTRWGSGIGGRRRDLRSTLARAHHHSRYARGRRERVLWLSSSRCPPLIGRRSGGAWRRPVRGGRGSEDEGVSKQPRP